MLNVSVYIAAMLFYVMPSIYTRKKRKKKISHLNSNKWTNVECQCIYSCYVISHYAINIYQKEKKDFSPKFKQMD